MLTLLILGGWGLACALFVHFERMQKCMHEMIQAYCQVVVADTRFRAAQHIATLFTSKIHTKF